MALITLLPANITVDCPHGTSVFQAALGNGIPVDTACGGKGTCGLCRVKVISGAEHLPEASFEERRFVGSGSNLRLSCRICPEKDLTVDIPTPRPPKKKIPKPTT